MNFLSFEREAHKNALHAAVLAQPELAALMGDGWARHASPLAAPLHRHVRLTGQRQAKHALYRDNRQLNGWPGPYVLTPMLLGAVRVVVPRGRLRRSFLECRHEAAQALSESDVQLRSRVAPAPARLLPEVCHACEVHPYLIDPLGQWTMRMLAQAEHEHVRPDLERPLRAAASSGRPGRA